MGIMDDEMDADMAQEKEDKDNAIRSKASKTWRILRLSSRNKLAAFDKIDDGKNLKVLFEAPPPPEEAPQPSEKTTSATAAQEEPQTQAPGKTTTETTEGGNSGNEQGPESSGVEKGDTAMTEQPSAESNQPEAPATTANQAS